MQNERYQQFKGNPALFKSESTNFIPNRPGLSQIIQNCATCTDTKSVVNNCHQLVRAHSVCDSCSYDNLLLRSFKKTSVRNSTNFLSASVLSNSLLYHRGQIEFAKVVRRQMCLTCNKNKVPILYIMQHHGTIDLQLLDIILDYVKLPNIANCYLKPSISKHQDANLVQFSHQSIDDFVHKFISNRTDSVLFLDKIVNESQEIDSCQSLDACHTLARIFTKLSSEEHSNLKVCLVPIAISYELLQGAFESLNISRAIKNYIIGEPNYGSICYQFLSPVDLKKFHDSMQRYSPNKSYELDLDSEHSSMSLDKDGNGELIQEAEDGSANRESFYNASRTVVKHIQTFIQQNTVVLPIHLVSFILISSKDLCANLYKILGLLVWFDESKINFHMHTSFNGHPVDIMDYALSLLSNFVVIIPGDDQSESRSGYKRVQVRSDSLHNVLSYAQLPMIHMCFEAAILLTMLKLFARKKQVNLNEFIYDKIAELEFVKVEKSCLIEDCLPIFKELDSRFCLIPPCKSNELMIDNCIQNLSLMDFVKLEEPQIRSKTARTFIDTLDCYCADDDEYLDPIAYEKLHTTWIHLTRDKYKLEIVNQLMRAVRMYL